MKPLVIGICVLLINSFSFAAVYRVTDEYGNVKYTDTPSVSNAEKTKVEEIISEREAFNRSELEQYPQQTKRVSYSNNYSNQNYMQETQINEQENLTNSAQYSTLEIISPANDEGIRANDGVMSVSVKSSPALQNEHSLVVLVDGKEYATSNSNSITLNGLERGTHSLQVRIVNSDGSVIKSSATTTFHIIKTTVTQANAVRNREQQAKANKNGKNKPKVSNLPSNLPPKKSNLPINLPKKDNKK